MSENVRALVMEIWLKNTRMLVLLSIPMLFFHERLPLLLGLTLGGGVAMLSFGLIAWNSESILDRDDSIALSFGAFYLFRMILSGVAIFLGIFLLQVNLFTVVLGLFSVRISLSIAPVFQLLKKEKDQDLPL